MFNRYTQLLISLFALIILSPLILNVEANFPVVSFLFALVLVMTLRALELKKHVFMIIAGLAGFGFFLECLLSFHFIHTHTQLIVLITLLTFAAFIGISILIMLRNLFTAKMITADSVRGGICIYLLIGVFWGVLYQTIATIDPNSFMEPFMKVDGDVRYLLFYYSYATLTSLAFGDIMPATEVTRILSVLETITGVLFLSIFIAQLVSQHMEHKNSLKKQA